MALLQDISLSILRLVFSNIIQPATVNVSKMCLKYYIYKYLISRSQCIFTVRLVKVFILFIDSCFFHSFYLFIFLLLFLFLFLFICFCFSSFLFFIYSLILNLTFISPFLLQPFSSIPRSAF